MMEDVFTECPVCNAPLTAPNSFEAAAHISSWKDIETAPKDGTDIIAMEKGVGVPAVIYWNDTPAWNCWCFSAVLISLGDIKITHWMPLPEPPK